MNLKNFTNRQLLRRVLHAERMENKWQWRLGWYGFDFDNPERQDSLHMYAMWGTLMSRLHDEEDRRGEEYDAFCEHAGWHREEG